MQKKIKSALISVFYKDGLEDLVRSLHKMGVTIYSTGGTQKFIEELGINCVAVESVTGYPSILGGRVKTLHPNIFGGILGKRNDDTHLAEMQQYNIPEIDLVIVDLYPFEETVKNTTNENEIIEKIDIGGPSMLRAAAKNHQAVVVLGSKNDYSKLLEIIEAQNGETTLEQRRAFAIKAFDVCTHYDNAISNYFHQLSVETIFNKEETVLRYGENPHQKASFYGDSKALFTQLHGKELSYNNLVDVDAALEVLKDFTDEKESLFGIIKHTNVCGIAIKDNLHNAWEAALAGDKESAFGGILFTNKKVDAVTATAIQELFFEVLIAPDFEETALEILQKKKNRILLEVKELPQSTYAYRSLLNGVLLQQEDEGNYKEWQETGGRSVTDAEKEDLIFANIVCKHLKSNAIALVKNKQLLGKGCGQTSRIDALRQSIEKAKQMEQNLEKAVLASDAFFPFDDCVKIAHENGIEAFIQPGGSIRDADSINYCKENNLAMVLTGLRHFKH